MHSQSASDEVRGLVGDRAFGRKWRSVLEAALPPLALSVLDREVGQGTFRSLVLSPPTKIDALRAFDLRCVRLF